MESHHIPQKDAAFYIDSGLSYYNLDEFDKAITEFTHALDLKPNDAILNYYIGLAYESQNKLLDAISFLNKSIEIKPSYESYNKRGCCYFDLDNYANAITDFNHSISLYPNYAFPYYNRGHAYFERGNKAMTLSDFTKAFELDQNSKLFRNSLKIFLKNEHLDILLMQLEKLHEKDRIRVILLFLDKNSLMRKYIKNIKISRGTLMAIEVQLKKILELHLHKNILLFNAAFHDIKSTFHTNSIPIDVTQLILNEYNTRITGTTYSFGFFSNRTKETPVARQNNINKKVF